MKVTIEIEAAMDSQALLILAGIYDRAAANRMFAHDERVDIPPFNGAFSVRVERENMHATAPEPDPAPSALDRIADSLARIEEHMRPLVVATPAPIEDALNLGDLKRTAEMSDRVDLPSNLLLRLVEAAEKQRPVTTERVVHNLHWISNIAYNMSQNVKASNLTPEAEFGRVFVMAETIARELGVKL